MPDELKFITPEGDPYFVELINGMTVFEAVRAVAFLSMDATYSGGEYTETHKSEKIKVLGGGALIFDANLSEVTFAEEVPPRTVTLTVIEGAILNLLARNTGSLVTKRMIAEAGSYGDLTENSISTHVSNLRNKLKPNKELIENVRGQGYIIRSKTS